MTGPLTDVQADHLVALVRAAVDARRDYERVAWAAVPTTEEAMANWDRRVDAAHKAARAAERAAVQAIRALRGTDAGHGTEGATTLD